MSARRNPPGRTGVPNSPYRGILKHKRWSPGGGFGTLCPTWTHAVAGHRFAGGVHAHPWSSTEAHRLFAVSVSGSDGLPYAAARGIAFVARNSGDGTWHGYPVPWNDVPSDVQDKLIQAGQARRADLRRQPTIRQSDLRWALATDDE